MPGRYLKTPVFQSFTSKILLFGVVAGVIPLVSILVTISLFSHSLLQDLRRSLDHLKTREGQRLESQQHRLVYQQVRQKALDVAQDLAQYLKNHPHRTWEEMRRDPEFRDIVVQPVGVVGETFLMASPGKTILLHSQPAHEGQTLEKALVCQGRLTEPSDLRFGPPGILQEFSLARGPGKADCQGILVPVRLRPQGGEELLVGAWVDPGEMDLILAQSRAIFKTALNVTGTIIETRLRQFQLYQFHFLAFLGLVAFVASLALARRLTTQVACLTRAAEAFNRGDLNYRIMKPGRNELGQLAHTLNCMAASLKDNTISRLEWENTFNILPDPVILVDTEERISRLNRAAAAYLGVSTEEAVGCRGPELRTSGVAPFPSWAFVNALEHGVKTHFEFCADNGDTFLISVDPCWDKEGRVNGAVFVAREITALKKMQKELAQATNFLQQLIESAPLGITFINSQGLITRANPQFYREFGYKPEDILNRHYSFLYASEAERQQVLGEIRTKGEVLGRQVLLQHESGYPVPARISIRKLYGENGRVMGSVALSSNISEEVSLQRQLEQAQKQEAIASLAGGLAHNFNNLLTIILGLSTLMLAKIPPDNPAHADLLDIRHQVLAGRDITHKLLSFRRATDFKTQPLDLNRLVEATADMFGRTRPELLIRLELTRDLPAVEVDSGQVQQVLMNLLINAWQSMPQGGTITLQTRAVQLTDWQDPDWEVEPGPFVCLSVTDTGVGMDEETVRHLFEPFFTTKEPDQGSGLGLASACRIMKSHGGAIQVKSRPGEGSTFTLFFPGSTASPRADAAGESLTISGQGTILVVDDEPTLRRVAGRLLERLGYQVLEAADGESALEIYARRNGDVDLVLLDVIMPGLSGLQTLERLRILDPQVRVLLCSGLSETVEDNLPDGVDFLPKPYPLETLSQKVAAALRH